MVDTTAARARLERLLAELEESAATLRSVAGGDTGELSSYDQHPADSGANLVDADREEASVEVIRDQIERVHEALERVANGTYGQCVDCGRELPEERLDVRPEAARCVGCQQRVEAAR